MLKSISPYLRLGRLNNLLGALLLLLPAYLSLELNYNSANTSIYQLIYYYFIFLIGSVLMRSFGCVINDMADVEFDKKVARTKNRPLAAGEINYRQALYFLVTLGCFSLVLLLSLNFFAQIIALISLIFVIIYPFSKRYTNYPQLVLGFTFNWGVLLADAVMNRSISTNSILLYIACILWTLAYDTIYSYQDYEDDKKANVKSLPMILGSKPHLLINSTYVAMFFIILYLALTNGFSVYFYILFLPMVCGLFYQLSKLSYKSARQCGIFFKYNVYFGVFLWIAFLIA